MKPILIVLDMVFTFLTYASLPILILVIPQNFLQNKNRDKWNHIKQHWDTYFIPVPILLPLTLYWEEERPRSYYFGPWVYPMGSIVIVLVSTFVRPFSSPSVLIYLGNRWLVFLKLCMKLGVNKVKKVTRPEFWEKILIWGLQQLGFWTFFSKPAKSF